MKSKKIFIENFAEIYPTLLTLKSESHCAKAGFGYYFPKDDAIFELAYVNEEYISIKILKKEAS